MKFTKVQKRYIESKNVGYSFVKGKKASGKTTAAIWRTINLENNNCMYDDDKILFLCKDNYSLKEAKSLYKAEKEQNDFYSLFSIDEDRVEFYVVSELIDSYSFKYKRNSNARYESIDYHNGLEIIKDEEFIKSLELYKIKSKLLRNITLEELYDEILWIKLCNFTLEEYLGVQRKNRKKKINKNTIGRQFIYKLFQQYNSLLKLYGAMDQHDNLMFAIKESMKSEEKYSHIIIDNAESFNKGQIDFVKSLYKDDNYTSMTYIIDTEAAKKNDLWLYKGRKLKEIINENESKNFAFRTNFEERNTTVDYIRQYKYINFKNRNISLFNIDESLNCKEIFLEDNITFNEEELAEIPVFNDIAAGEPIEINDNIEKSFYLPKGWLERGKDTFILHVKGDSMIDKQICDGDLVVIKKQQMAYNNDIVAASIDGEATLKILNVNGKIPMLMPANEKYMPIMICDKEISILGVALGVIKQET